MSNLLDSFKPKKDHNNDKPHMPRGPEPTIPRPNPNLAEEQFAVEAARAAQRHMDLVAQVEAYKEEAHNWQHKCHALEILIDELRREKLALTHELDEHKTIITTLKTQFSLASDILLKAFHLIDQTHPAPTSSETFETMLGAAPLEPEHNE